jgi:hypothetical protein
MLEGAFPLTRIKYLFTLAVSGREISLLSLYEQQTGKEKV